MPKRTLKLPPAERERLLKLVSLGQHPASAIRRAYILLHSDGGRTDEVIAQFLFCSEDSVCRTRVRYLTEGLDAALEDKPRPGREPLLTAQQEAYLIALACSTPPAGQERWTLELFSSPADRRRTSRRHLNGNGPTHAQKNKLKPWLVKS